MISPAEQKNAAVLYADLQRTAIGTRARIADQLVGQPVLGRTVNQLQAADNLAQIIVFCPQDQQPTLEQLLDGAEAIVHGLQQPVPPNPRVQRRKWALTSWRGGLGEATVFDEQSFTPEMIQVLAERQIISVLAVPSEAVVIDPDLITGLVAHHREFGSEMRFTFSQAAPGLLGCMYRLDLLAELVQARAAIGDLLAYDPNAPQADSVNQNCTYRVAQHLCTSENRYLADTTRSFARLERTLRQTDPAAQPHTNAEDIVRTMTTLTLEPDPLPAELEIEINTAPSLRINGYPHRQMQNQRGPMTLPQFEKIVTDCTEYDDICLTIGGFGEPLAHPDLPAFVRTAKSAGIFALNIETDGRALNEQLADQLIQAGADVISIHLDANSEQMYQQVKDTDGFETIARRIELLAARCRTADHHTMIVPHLTKTRATMAEMEAFYDRWLQCCGAAVIAGYNDHAAQIPDQSVMDMSPPGRWPCPRLFRRLTILADGTVTPCTQDFRPTTPLANAFNQTITEIWQDQPLQQLRQAHQDADFEQNPLCAACREWHR